MVMGDIPATDILVTMDILVMEVTTDILVMEVITVDTVVPIIEAIMAAHMEVTTTEAMEGLGSGSKPEEGLTIERGAN